MRVRLRQSLDPHEVRVGLGRKLAQSDRLAGLGQHVPEPPSKRGVLEQSAHPLDVAPFQRPPGLPIADDAALVELHRPAQDAPRGRGVQAQVVAEVPQRDDRHRVVDAHVRAQQTLRGVLGALASEAVDVAAVHRTAGAADHLLHVLLDVARVQVRRPLVELPVLGPDGAQPVGVLVEDRGAQPPQDLDDLGLVQAAVELLAQSQQGVTIVHRRPTVAGGDDRLEPLGAHHRTHARPAGRILARVHDAGETHQVLAGRADHRGAHVRTEVPLDRRLGLRDVEPPVRVGGSDLDRPPLGEEVDRTLRRPGDHDAVHPRALEMGGEEAAHVGVAQAAGFRRAGGDVHAPGVGHGVAGQQPGAEHQDVLRPQGVGGGGQHGQQGSHVHPPAAKERPHPLVRRRHEPHGSGAQVDVGGGPHGAIRPPGEAAGRPGRRRATRPSRPLGRVPTAR